MSILYEVTDSVATIVLNRPEALNSLDPETLAELNRTFEIANRDERVRVVVLTGSGEKAFCTGSDLKKTMPPKESFAELTFGREKWLYPFAGLEIDKPMICAVNGFALAGGMELALACDIRIASSNAQFGQSEVCVGSIPAAGGTQRLPRMVGMSDAMLMMLTGDRIDAETALRIGLVSRVVPLENLRDEAMKIAWRIADNAPLAVRAVKRLVRDGLDLPLLTAIQSEQFALGLLRDTEDRLEGRRAFQEKRKPVFTGK
ncbi:enoyl-CoA hydratase/isomerase family protein [Paraburkholderia silviterrae]|uniref:Enoyl-CoA hydratase/isomerase family protein n=1 Tax=Paraburkholderia silviterrae TaxID=2528715 RepID=A0A4R5M3W0_9BURK|nr:enoyl-CoA hydratase-related protein [Paraburkholderia silviterrae]TDG19956.1 enoyl-CoA hydratase/isomerase family protein [Paraburkholderia silviterrae]